MRRGHSRSLPRGNGTGKGFRNPPAGIEPPGAADSQPPPAADAQPISDPPGVQDAAEQAPEPLQFEEDVVVVVGSRAPPRSVTESMAPIDAIPFEELASQGETDVGDQLRAIVPSYNVNPQPGGRRGAHHPAGETCAGWPPDHTLVLVNGKRRHRGAVITWIGNGVSDGAQGPDISTIPAIALRRVEVLRDGASAQYGSDAIAGVLNFLLKDAPSGGSLELHSGGYGAGDGGAYNGERQHRPAPGAGPGSPT